MAGLLTDEDIGLSTPKSAVGPADGLLLSDEDVGLAPHKKAPQAAPVTLEERFEQTYGPDELIDRATFLPVGVSQEGNLKFAVPEVLRGMAKSALLPEHVAKGGAYSPQEAIGFTLDFLLPGVTGRGPGTQTARTSRKALVANAPSTEQLRTASVAAKGAATASGLVAHPQAQNRLISRIVGVANKERVRPGAHPKSVSALKGFRSYAGKQMDVEDLIGHRQMLQDAASSLEPADRRVAMLMIEELDDFIENGLRASDFAGGNKADVARNLHAFRQNWARAKRSEMIEGVIERASRYKSGFESGVVSEINKILNSPKKIRGFSKSEIKLMRDIAKGKGVNIAKLIGKFGFGTRGNRMLGGTIGATGGGALGGPLGAAAVPAAGQIAERGADALALNNLNVLRAATASGVDVPAGRGAWNAIGALLNKGAGPVAGTQLNRGAPAPGGQTITLPDGSRVTLDPNIL